MYFRRFVSIENGLLVYYFPFILLLEYQVVPMLEFILLNSYKIMPVDQKKRVLFEYNRTFLLFLAFYSIIIAVLFEAIAVSWLYGIKRISEDVKQMLGTKPGIFWIGTWCFVAPVFLGVIEIT
jgi:hypothetical protein